MKIASTLHDGRIKATNYLIEIEIGEYIDIARKIIHNNGLQRKRVSNSNTVYSLLKTDAALGCVIPPIVIALSSDEVVELTEKNLKDMLSKNVEHLMILDGQQRTHSLIDIEDGLLTKGNHEDLGKYRALPIRCEIYLGINRIGILYRMLTLNTGQTPMSLRQQIEMLYQDYAKAGIDGITLAREVDKTKAKGISTYNFKEVVEGFNCYLERNELPIERADLLENIKSLEKLSLENSNKDIFKEYVSAFNKFILKVSELMKDARVDDEDDAPESVWGKSGVQLFKKQQALAGFGTAVGKLKDHNIVGGFGDVSEAITNLTVGAEPDEVIADFNKAMAWIGQTAKKIGNAQRMFFQYYFRELFNSSGDAHLNMMAAIEVAVQKYKSQVL